MKKSEKKGIWFYGLSGTGKTYASKILAKKKKNSILIDGDDVRKLLSQDLGYSSHDREIQIKRIFGITKIVLKSNLFPVISTVYMNKYIAKNLKKNKVHLVKINRDLKKIMKKHKTYKNKKNVVGKDIQLESIKSTQIFNSGEKSFCKNIMKLIK
jgi:adenylylsulfate kinase-like enzyme|tara:strand:- start:3008 stop:3472 length:465 start_codon:yes stop_codon:yes gene_type:complete